MVLPLSLIRRTPRRRRIVVLVGLEFIVSGGLGRGLTMTQLTVESLSRIHSRFPYLRIPFKVTQIQEHSFNMKVLCPPPLVCISGPCLAQL